MLNACKGGEHLIAGKRISPAEAYHYIKRLIITQEIPPGSEIREENLARLIGVSRTPVREALRLLEGEGLITRKGRRRYVYTLTIDEINQIFDIKEALEPYLAMRAAQQGGCNERVQLYILGTRMKQVGQMVDQNNLNQLLLPSWLELDQQFHDLIYIMAKNMKAKNILGTLNSQWQRVKEGLLALQGRISRSGVEHFAIATAIFKKDKQASYEAMLDHLRNVREAVIAVFKTAGFAETG
jgi:DNA-binding GntR family transcriptional regulator